MIRRLGLLVAWLLLVAVPLQGMSASAMLFCAASPHGQHEAHQSRAFQMPHEQHGRHMHAADGGAAHGHADPAGHGKSHGSPATPADAKCSVCAACCFGAAISDTPHVMSFSMPNAPLAAPGTVQVRFRATPPPDKPPRA